MQLREAAALPATTVQAIRVGGVEAHALPSRRRFAIDSRSASRCTRSKSVIRAAALQAALTVAGVHSSFVTSPISRSRTFTTERALNSGASADWTAGVVS